MFSGFTDKETFTQVPDSFFRNLLNEIDDADELKVTLYALWCIGQMEGGLHALRAENFTACVPDPAPALEKAVQRGSLLKASPRGANGGKQEGAEVYYFLNSPRGRAAAESLQSGQVSPDSLTPSAPLPARPNIFKLYEENIGPLTPPIADALKDAEQTYPPEWVNEAIEIAVKKNKRNLKYVEAILRRWKEEDHAKKQDRRDSQEGSHRYTEGEFAEYLKRD